MADQPSPRRRNQDGQLTFFVVVTVIVFSLGCLLLAHRFGEMRSPTMAILCLLAIGSLVGGGVGVLTGRFWRYAIAGTIAWALFVGITYVVQSFRAGW